METTNTIKKSTIPTVNFSDVEFRTNDIKEAAKLLLDNGFRIFIYKASGKTTNFKYSDGKNIAYAQIGDFFGRFTVSTIHKPHKQVGTGFRLDPDDDTKTDLEYLKKGFIIAPHWASKDISFVKKYESVEEWYKSEKILKYSEVIK